MHYSKKHSLWMPYEEKDDIAIDVVTKEVEYIDEVMKYVRKREGCIQAGGHIGVYPKKLSTYFTRVFTFEPDLNNHATSVALEPSEYSKIICKKFRLLGS